MKETIDKLDFIKIENHFLKDQLRKLRHKPKENIHKTEI